MFHVKRRKGHGYKPGEMKARFDRRWLAFLSRSNARSRARRGMTPLKAVEGTE